MAKPGNAGFRRIILATRYSAMGLKQAWQHEAAFRQEIALFVVLIPGALWLGQSAVERVLLIGCCLLVLIVELLNSAIEATSIVSGASNTNCLIAQRTSGRPQYL